MANQPKDPIGRITENLFRVQRLGNRVLADSLEVLDRIRDEIVADLIQIDPTGPSAARWRQYRTEEFVERVAERMGDGAEEFRRIVRDDLAVIGRSQAKWAEATLVTSLGPAGGRVSPTTVTQARMKAILDSRPFDGVLLADEAARMGEAARRAVSAEIRRGMAQEESIDELVRRVRGKQAGWIRQDPNTGEFVPAGTRGATRKPRYTGGVWATTNRNAEAVVRTFVSAVSNEAHRATYTENERLLEGLGFSATLDEKTTPICASLDGTVWPTDSPDIRQPPLHLRCRSVLVPVIDWKGLGLDPPDPGVRAARRLDVDEDGVITPGRTYRVPERVDYEQWLRTEPVAVQERVMGVERAKLWREGKIGSFKDLVTGDGRWIPLDQIG